MGGLGVSVAWPSPASSVVLCHSFVQLMLSVSVRGRGLKGRVVRSPPPLLKGYNVGGESQAKRLDFVPRQTTQAAQAAGRRQVIGRCRNRLERPLERCVIFVSPDIANTGVIIRRDIALAAFHGRYYQTC